MGGNGRGGKGRGWKNKNQQYGYSVSGHNYWGCQRHRPSQQCYGNTEGYQGRQTSQQWHGNTEGCQGRQPSQQWHGNTGGCQERQPSQQWHRETYHGHDQRKTYENNGAEHYLGRNSNTHSNTAQRYSASSTNIPDGKNNTESSTGARSKDTLNFDDKLSTSNRSCENNAVKMQEDAAASNSSHEIPGDEQQMQWAIHDGCKNQEQKQTAHQESIHQQLAQESTVSSTIPSRECGASCMDKTCKKLQPTLEKDISKPVVTVYGDKDRKNEKAQESSSTSQHKSQVMKHNNKCLELGKRCTKYCNACKLWLCDECAAIGHKKTPCTLIPHTDALRDKKQQYENIINATADNIKISVQEHETYNSQLEAALMLMRAAFENIEKKRELVKAYIHDGTQRLEKLEAEKAEFPDAKNLPEALAIFNDIERDSTEAHSWLSKKTQCTGNTGRIEGVLKEMLYMTFECHQSLKKESQMQRPIYVSRTLPDGTKLSELKAEGSRIYIQSLTFQQSVNEGSRVLPLEYIMSCVDFNSRLAFFDLSWGGIQQGRVFVRLLGDTQRGRQFVKLCTGETGPCFRGSHFHRVWWKGQDGEHVWGGDYERGDGSGGQGLTEDNKEALVPHRKAPITTGLVAGRYEKDNVSSIFRIFTKGVEGMMEEAAFGHVEFGLNIIEEAAKLNNIADVTIEECGVVLEV